jgi:hypothetical protein
LLVLAGATLATTTVLGLTFQGSERKEGLLVTANRERLAICVQAVGTDAGAEMDVKRRIEALLPQLMEHPRWRPAGLGAAPPVVDIGCPSDPALLRPGAHPKGGDPSSSSLVLEASPYLVFVFILPQAEIDRLFSNWPYRKVPQENLCEGHVCFEVTTGLYLSPGEAQQAPFLLESLLKAIGLEPPDP